MEGKLGRGRLVLKRGVGQKIVIGDNIVLTVVQVGRGQIRLGIDAPKGMAIERDNMKEGKK